MGNQKRNISEVETSAQEPASLLKPSEVSFPRGGASALTPMEVKEVANQAARDVLFESKAEEKAAAAASSSSGADSKKKRKLNKKLKKLADSTGLDAEDKDKVPIEHLSFKNCVAGSYVLGQIVEITKFDIGLAISDNLIGYVPITNVSSELNKKIEAAEASDDDDNEDEDEDEIDNEAEDSEESELPALTDTFTKGQWLRALVVESSTEQRKKGRKHKRIELTIEPAIVNDNLDEEDFLPGQALQGSIKSVEDHGLIVNVGKFEVSGFISKKDFEEAGYCKIDQVKEGSVYLFVVGKKLKNSRVVDLKLSHTQPAIEKISSLDAVLPGNVVEAIVKEVSNYGIVCSVYGTLKASINLPSAGIATNLKDRFEIGGKVKTKIIASITTQGDKKLLLSILPHVMKFESNTNTQDPLTVFPIGFTVEKATIVSKDSSYYYLDLGLGGKVFGQVHNSRTNPKLEYSLMSEQKAKVVDYDYFNNMYVMSMDPKILEQKYIRAEDIPLGEVVVGVVETVSGTEGITMKIFDTFTAYIEPKHVSDIKLVYPERKYKVGSKVKARVMKVHKNRVIATMKKTLINTEKVLTDYSNISVGDKTIGTIENIMNNGAVVSFFGKVRAFLPKSEISEAFVRNPQDYLKLGQSINVIVQMVNPETERMTVSCKITAKSEKLENSETKKNNVQLISGKSLVKVTVLEKNKDALIVSIEGSSLHGVIYSGHLSDGNYEQNRQLHKATKVGDVLENVLVLDKDRKNRLVILTKKESMVTDAEKQVLPATFADVVSRRESGTLLHGFIKSITEKGLFIGFGGKLVGLLLKKYAIRNKSADLNSHYKQHQTVEVHVLRTDEESQRFLLSVTNEQVSRKNKKSITDDDSQYTLEIGEVVPGKVRSIQDTFVMVELVQKKQGFCYITNALVDYDKDLKEVYQVGQIVKAKILSKEHNKFKISLRPNFTENVVDKYIDSVNDLKVGDTVRGFVKNINDKGVFVALSADLYALVRVTDLSDQYLKNWKKFFEVNSVVKGRILSIKDGNLISMTLKESQLTGELIVVKSFDELKVGDIYDGHVKNVTEFGVFVSLDHTNNISGLSHKSEISDDGVVEDCSKLFGEGDKVKVKILKVDKKKKQLSLGMKASYFSDSIDYAGDSDDDEDEGSGMEVDDDEENHVEDDDEEMEVDGEVDFDEESGSESEKEGESDGEISKDSEEELNENAMSTGLGGLSTNGFDWTASILDQAVDNGDEDSEDESERSKNKKSKHKIVQDKTAELNTKAPQSVQDFERLLIGEPNSSVLWMNYMSFQLQLSEIEKAREIAERALKTINYREEQEKLNIWIALLNLENTFGTEETLQQIFKRACQYMDSLTIHQKLAGIYIMSEKKEQAEALFKVMTKKFNSEVSVWINFGKFYLENHQSTEAHELLARALKSLPSKDHVDVVKKFGQMEFKIGDPEQGRTLFEGLIADKPKRIDLWNVYIDQEIKQNEKQKVEDLFERVVVKKLSNKQKKFFFTKWLEFEIAQEDEKMCEYVKAKAREVAEKKDEE